MSEHKEIDKSVRKSKFAAGLKSLSHGQLVEISHAVNSEMERRAKEKSEHKKPSEMGDKEFENYKSKLFSAKDGDEE